MKDCQETDNLLRDVRRIVRDALEGTSLREHVARFGSTVGGGKMLRARLILRIGPAAAVAPTTLCRAAAAVEMLHAASLLHDDILDGGTLRRGNPALWVSEGTRSAVILGDLLVSLAVEGVHEVLPTHLPALIATLREMCDAEAEQEFGAADAGEESWARCVSIARRKTGSLFGFAAACTGGSEPERVEALRRAGYALGTAYQLADDLLDACATPLVSDKSLGSDAATGKLTAASALPPGGMAPQDAIESLLHDSEDDLIRWPHVRAAWDGYVRDTMAPLLAPFAGAAPMEAIA
jgi:geranylgeranyl pyrophosphate synthase